MRKLTVIAFVLLVVCDFEMVSQPCLPNGITFTTQSQIDSFPILYPTCTEIEGDVFIWDADITSLSSLNNLSSIGGALEVFGCVRLIDLTGLEGISHIGGRLFLLYNDSLTNLTSFSGLISIGGELHIIANHTLNSLAGIENIDANTIGNLSIFWNDSLSTCDVTSICSHLANPNPYIISIYDNNIGCNSVSEVEEACTVGIPEQRSDPQLSAHPNPFTNTAIIEYELTEPTHIQLTIYNHLGEVVEEAVGAYCLPGVHAYEWSAERLSEGMYFAVLRSGDGVSVVKMIKQ